MKLWKRNVVVAAIVLFVCVAVYLNWSYNREDDTADAGKTLGEAALVEYHSPISMSGLVYYTTLIDENASCHLALGRGLNMSPQGNEGIFNDSTIHVDFMIGTPDMKIVGTTEDGKEVEIFRDGDFAI